MTCGTVAGVNPSGLPDGLQAYKCTGIFTPATVPAALRKDHCTKAGTWGLIHVSEGALLYCITDPRRPASETLLLPDGPPGIVEPSILHHVKPMGDVRFRVEFWRTKPDRPGDPLSPAAGVPG
jgi:tellurite resistance-related uncharacterized protein